MRSLDIPAESTCSGIFSRRWSSTWSRWGRGENGGSVWCWKHRDFIGWIMVLYGCYMVLYGFIWFYMVLYGFIWFYGDFVWCWFDFFFLCRLGHILEDLMVDLMAFCWCDPWRLRWSSRMLWWWASARMWIQRAPPGMSRKWILAEKNPGDFWGILW